MTIIGILAGVLLVWLTVHLVWRWMSRHYSLPCPTLFASALNTTLMHWLLRTNTTLERIAFRPGQRVLEIGPGPGRLLVPAAQRILPGGEAVGVDIQPGMIERLNKSKAAEQLDNLTGIVGDATQSIVGPESFDLVYLCRTLGEIPNREAVLGRCHEALKPGGRLSNTEIFPDPHYQSRATLLRLANKAGFAWQKTEGNVLFYTMTFIKPNRLSRFH